MDLKAAISRVVDRQDLSADEITSVFDLMMNGAGTPAQIGALLIGLRMKGVTPAELAGAARSMRSHATAVTVPDPERAVDTCGTGGDGAGLVNISTMAAIVVAAAGGCVAKHGNRALSSKCGSADLLEELGIAIEAPVTVVERCLRELGIGFLFAPLHHAATRHVAGPRRELGTRTIFNLLGPMTNPAGARNQLIGVFAAQWCEPMAAALGQLGSRRVYVVHGAGGLDEIAVRGATRVACFDHASGDVTSSEVTPADFGLDEANPADLVGGDATHNAAVARGLLDGASGAVRCAVVMTAAMALVACGLATDFREGAERAAEAIDSGTARELLARWTVLSRAS